MGVLPLVHTGGADGKLQEGSSREGENDGGTAHDLSRGSQREKVEQLRLQQGELNVSASGGDPSFCPAVFYETRTAVEGRVG